MTVKFSQGSKITVNPSFVLLTKPNESILISYDPDDKVYLELTGSSAALWDFLQHSSNISLFTSRIEEHFNGPLETDDWHHINSFLDTLIQHGAITIASE